MTFVDFNLVGQLLLTLPNTLHKELSRVSMIVAQNWSSGSECLVVNRPLRQVTVSQVMANAGIEYGGIEPVYWGGGTDINRIQVLHSLDWSGPSTQRLNDSIGLTSDISVLAAIAGFSGPEHWRCISGHLVMGPHVLEQQLHSVGEFNDARWGYLKLPASTDLVFKGSSDEQWLTAIAEAGKVTVDTWF